MTAHLSDHTVIAIAKDGKQFLLDIPNADVSILAEAGGVEVVVRGLRVSYTQTPSEQ